MWVTPFLQDAKVTIRMTNYCTFWGEDGGNPELTSFLGEDLHSKARWWFQICFMFIPTWKNDPIWGKNLTRMGGKKPPTRRCLATNSFFLVEKPFPSGCTRFGGHGWLVSQLKIWTKKRRSGRRKVFIISFHGMIVTSYALWNLRVDFLLVATKYTQDRRSGLLLRHRWNCVDFHLLKLGTLKSSFSSGEMWWNRGMRLHGICDAWCFETMEHQSHAGKKNGNSWSGIRAESPWPFLGGNTERSAIRMF